MTEMQSSNMRALRAKIARGDALTTADRIYEATELLGEATGRVIAARHRLAELAATPDPLPAPALTEDAIVAALKADPAMAGRVIARFACRACRDDLSKVTEEAQFTCEAGAPLATGYAALQSLAVALAAASYRG